MYFIKHETALLAKQAGFDKYIDHCYDGMGRGIHLGWNTAAVHPSFSPRCQHHELKNWLLEHRHIHIQVRFDDNHWYGEIGYFTTPDFAPERFVKLSESEAFSDSINRHYQVMDKALHEGLKLLLKLK